MVADPIDSQVVSLGYVFEGLAERREVAPS